ncbi:alpha/beta fold hydrolase [Pseudoxanthomonas sangjuensis]
MPSPPKPGPAPVPTHAEAFVVAGAGGLELAATRFPAANSGRTARAPLLYAHGFGQTRDAWRRTASTMAALGHAGLSYDARGHGESRRNPADLPYRVEQFADDMINVVGALAQAPVLIGASMGGLFGLVTEARWPGLFRALVLVDVTPRWEAAGYERILAFMSAFPNGFDSLAHAADVVAAYLPHRRERKSESDLRGLLREGADGRWRWHWDPRLIAEVAEGVEGHQDDLVEAARRVRCPVLLISGGRSDLVSTRTIAEFQALVPHARHAHLPHATHMLAGDDNDAFAATVLDYLAELPASAPDAVAGSLPAVPAANDPLASNESAGASP